MSFLKRRTLLLEFLKKTTIFLRFVDIETEGDSYGYSKKDCQTMANQKM